MRALLLSTIVLSFLSVSIDAAAAARDGVWIGGIDLGTTYDYTRAEFKNDGKNVEVKVWDPTEVSTVAVGGIGETIELDIPWRGGRLHLSGRITNAVFRGTAVSSAGARGSFVLRRRAAVDPAVVATYSGAYEVSPGHVITLHADGSSIFFHDSDSGRYGAALAVSETRFVNGPTKLRFDPIAVEITVEKNVPSIRFAQAGHPTLHARKGAFLEHEVSFRNGDAELRGTVRLPKARGPHPGVVLVAGSGPQTRNGFDAHLRIHADMFAANGFAVLNYDKRGTGQSTGESSAPLEVLAADAAAAVRVLKNHEGVASDRVGMWGASQGGILAPFIADREPLAFIVNVGGTVVNPEEQEIYRVEATMRQAGAPEPEIAEAVGLQILKFYYARTGLGWNSYLQARTRNTDKTWLKEVVMYAPDTKEASSWAFWKAINIELEPWWRRVDEPILVIYGGRDLLSPIDRSVAVMKNVLAGRAGSDVRVIAVGDHNIFDAPSGLERDTSLITRYVPGYFRDLISWMKISSSPRQRGAAARAGGR